MKARLMLLALLGLVACASYNGRGLRLGIDGYAQVIQLMGTPSMQWDSPDGSRQLAFARGPAGYDTYMVFIGADGLLQKKENVLNREHFILITPGMDKEDVLRIIGPSQPAWTAYFERRDELVWEWRYCDDWHEASRFDVLFDNTSSKVRTTYSITESQKGMCGRGKCSC